MARSIDVKERHLGEFATTGQPDGRKADEHLYGEKARIARLSRIREVVFGTLDGLLVPVGVVSAVAGGTGSTNAVIIAGLAEAFAGALSMGAGEFISGRSEAQVQKTEVRKNCARFATTRSSSWTRWRIFSATKA